MAAESANGHPGFGLRELIVFVVECVRRRAFVNIQFAITDGKIGIVKVEEHYKPGELPIRDRSQLNELTAPVNRLTTRAQEVRAS